jgi:hypothetical protein
VIIERGNFPASFKLNPPPAYKRDLGPVQEMGREIQDRTWLPRSPGFYHRLYII